MEHRDVAILKKIAEEVRLAKAFLGDMSAEDFARDEKTMHAVCMAVLNVGELVKNLSPETRDRYRTVPWRAAAGLRDKAAHKYFSLNMIDIWQTVNRDFPALLFQLNVILARESDGE